jgi:hypothetical protein
VSAGSATSAGAGTPASPYAEGDVYPVSGLCLSIATADFDGDGMPDFATPETNGGTVSIWLNDGSGHLSLAGRDTVGPQPLWAVTADFNGDQRQDIAVALNTNPGQVRIRAGDGDGSFSALATCGTGANPDHLAVGDLDSDGRPDLVTADFGAATVTVLMNQGNGGFAAPVMYAVERRPASVVIADLDSDGAQDLAVTDLGGAGLSTLHNLGDGTFAPRLAYGLPRPPVAAVAADLDGDGATDLALSDYTGSLQVIWNDGSGIFSRVDDYPCGNGSSANLGVDGTSNAVGGSSFSLKTCDLGDGGLPDLAVASGSNLDGASIVTLMRNQGDAASRPSCPTGSVAPTATRPARLSRSPTSPISMEMEPPIWPSCRATGRQLMARPTSRSWSCTASARPASGGSRPTPSTTSPTRADRRRPWTSRPAEGPT